MELSFDVKPKKDCGVTPVFPNLNSDRFFPQFLLAAGL